MTTDHPDNAPEHCSSENRQAIAWFTRMNGKPSRADRRNFRTWLEADERNVLAWEEVRSLMSAADAPGTRIADEEKAALATYLEGVKAIRHRRRAGKAGGTAVVALLFILSSAWLWLEKPHFLQDMQADYTTLRAERRTIVLADGSAVLLDADSAIGVDMAGGERRIRLLRGAAFFDVKPSSQPFVVEAGNGRSKVLGTAFDVAATEDGASVTLARGSLLVTAGSGEEALLSPGEAVDYGKAGMGARRTVDLEESMAWHEGRFIFNNARLADVLARIERHRDGRIVLLGSALAERRVSGSFSLEDTDGALSSVQSLVGFSMRKFGGRVVVVSP